MSPEALHQKSVKCSSVIYNEQIEGVSSKAKLNALSEKSKLKIVIIVAQVAAFFGPCYQSDLQLDKLTSGGLDNDTDMLFSTNIN